MRKILRAIAPGYRLHRRDVPGNPDIAYLGRKLATFVHGCFWRGHSCSRGARTPKNNAPYWIAKIERNRKRDRATRAKLRKAGWRTLTIWECEIKDKKAVGDRLTALIADNTLRSRRRPA